MAHSFFTIYGIPFTGIIRSLHAMGHLEHVYCTETRPYNQGARLTAYELVYERIPATLIADSMASVTMKEKKVSGEYFGAPLSCLAAKRSPNCFLCQQFTVSACFSNQPRIQACSNWAGLWREFCLLSSCCRQ